MNQAQQAIAFTNSLTDDLGRPLDEGIKKPVAALYLLGVKTSASCQGHSDHGLSYPWIDILDSYYHVNFLEDELTSFHLIKKGRGSKSILRLVPKRVKDIADNQQGDFSLELKELNQWADHQLKVAKTSS